MVLHNSDYMVWHGDNLRKCDKLKDYHILYVL
jgi:hypothetical protein